MQPHVQQHHRAQRPQVVAVARVGGDAATVALAECRARQLQHGAAAVAQQRAGVGACRRRGQAHADALRAAAQGGEFVELGELGFRQRRAHAQGFIGEHTPEQLAAAHEARVQVGGLRQRQPARRLRAHLERLHTLDEALQRGLPGHALGAVVAAACAARRCTRLGAGLHTFGFQRRHAGLLAQQVGLQLRVGQAQHHLAGQHQAAVGGFDAHHEAVLAAAQLGLVRGPHHRLHQGVLRQRQQQRHGHGGHAGQRQAPPAPRRGRLAHRGAVQLLQQAQRRRQQQLPTQQRAAQQAQRQRQGPQPQHCQGHHQQAVQPGQRGVGGQPRGLTACHRHGLGAGHAQRAPQQQVQPPLAAARAQVGQLQRVTQHEVAVQPLQRVGVEQQRGDSGDEQRDEGDVARPAFVQHQPHRQRDGGQAQLGHDAGGADGQALAALREAGGRRRVDVRHRQTHHQRDAGLVHGPAPAPHRQAVGELVHQLDGHVQRQRQQPEARGVQPQPAMRPQCLRVQQHQPRQQRHRQQPQPPGRAREQRLLRPGQPVEQARGVGQGDAPGQQAAAAAGPRQRVAVRQQPREVGRPVGLRQPVLAQPGQDVDQLVLGRRLAGQGLQQFPQLLHRAPAVQAAGEGVAGSIQAQATLALRVEQQHPAFTTQQLPLHAQLRRQTRPQLGDTVPARAVQRCHLSSVRPPRRN